METRFRKPIQLLDETALHDLQARLRGRLVLPDQNEYEIARRLWNGFIDRYPAVIVQCADSDDVSQAILFARRHNLPIAVRGGGHSFPGYSTVDDGLVIDLSGMKSVQVDIDRRTALVSGGAKLGEMIQATEQYGLVTPVGTASDTGVAGLTLGGGFGFLSGKYGLTVDNVLSFEVVTADGSKLHASADENPELFWGLRGGGGNFGVVTTFEYQLHPQQGVLGGMLVHPFSRAVEVLRFYRDSCEVAPDDLTIFAAIITNPEGRRAIGILPCYSGAPEEGERILAPLRKFGPPIADEVKWMTYLQMISMMDESTPPGLNYYDKGCTLPRLSDEVIDIIVEAGASMTSPYSAMIFQLMHGRAARVPVDATAYPIRSVNYMPVILACWKDGPGEEHIAWARRTYAAFQPHTANETYVNFISAEEQSKVPSVYGRNYERLRDLKRKYDPDNIFSRNANIKP